MVSPTSPTLQQRLQQRRVEADEPLSPTTSTRTAAGMGKSGKCVRKELLYKLGFENYAAVPTLPSNREPSRGSLLGQVQTRIEPLKYDANFDKVLAEKKERALQRASGTVTPGNAVFSALGALFTSSQAPPPQQSSAPAAAEDTARDDVESFKPSSLTSVDTESTANSDQCSLESSSETKAKRKSLSFNDQVTVVPIPKRDEYSKRIRGQLWVNAAELQSQVARNTVEFAWEGWDWKNACEDEAMYVCAETGEKVHPVHCETEE